VKSGARECDIESEEMGQRSKLKRHPWAGQPSKLVIHDDPYDIWAKLSWEVNEFHLRRTGERPLDIDGIVYLLQNACISTVAVVEWLRLQTKQSARQSGKFDDEVFDAEVAQWLPDIKLARAIANTFKHGEYRDEGWGTAEVRLDTLFDDDQHTRLRAAQGTDRFEDVYAEETFEADFRLTFQRSDKSQVVEADAFVQALSDGALRLLDATYGNHDRFIASRRKGVSDAPGQ
jgi:hypothetical protein